MKHTARAALAVALLVGFYAYGAAVLGGLGWMLVLAVEHGLPGFLAGKAFLVLAVVAVAVLGSLFRLRKDAPSAPPGLLLTPQQDPRLWAVVHHLAAVVGTRAPDEIRLVPDVNAAVSEESSWMGLRRGVRRMFVGAPLLTTFSEAELASVLAHELGHYSGRHTALAGLVYRSRETIGRTLDRLRDHPVVRTVFGWYARLYVAVTAATSRSQEIEADRFAVTVAGPSTATRALLAVGPLGAAWTYFLETYALAGREDGLRPTDLFGGFELFLNDPERQSQIAELNLRAEPGTTRWTDTHPPVEERVRAMERLGIADVTDDSPPAIELLGDYLEALRALEAVMFAGSGLRAATWDEVVGAGARRAWDQMSGLVADAARKQDGPLQLGGLLNAVGDGRFATYVSTVVADPDAHGTQAQHELLDALCRSALAAGGARIRVSWAGPAQLVGPHMHVLDPSPLISASIGSPLAVADLRAWLVAHGASLEHQPPPLPTDEDRREVAVTASPHLLAVVGPVACRDAFRLGGLCFVLNSGLVLRGLTRRERWAVGVAMGGGRGMVRAASQHSPEEVLGHPRAVLVGWDQVRGARATKKWGKQRVVFDLVDGRQLTLKWLDGTHEEGDFLPVVEYFLGERMDGVAPAPPRHRQ